jgi:hypothetical protein
MNVQVRKASRKDALLASEQGHQVSRDQNPPQGLGHNMLVSSQHTLVMF